MMLLAKLLAKLEIKWLYAYNTTILLIYIMAVLNVGYWYRCLRGYLLLLPMM